MVAGGQNRTADTRIFNSLLINKKGLRYAHLAPDHLAIAAQRLASKFEGYDLATVNQK